MKSYPTSPSSPTVREIIQQYQAHCQRNKIHGDAARVYRDRVFRLFVEAYGDTPVIDCKPYHLKEFIEGQAGVKSTSTRKAWATSINAAFTWAVNDERLGRNPFIRVKYDEAEPRPPMPDDVFADLVACANKPFDKACRFLRLTGCRLGELCGLTWPDVDLARGVAIIHHHKSRKQTRRAKILVLVPEVIDMLTAIRKLQPEGYEGTVFLNTAGTAWNRITLGQQLRRMKKRGLVNTSASLHGLRHAFGHQALRNGAPLALVAQALGHSSPVITFKTYGHLAQAVDEVRNAAALASPNGLKLERG